MRALAALAVLVLAGGAALAARDAAPLTKNSVRAMAPDALTRRLFGEVAPIMLPVADRVRPGGRPTQPLRRLTFLTVPHAANIEGMCQTQVVVVEFEPAGPLAGPDTPVRPRRIRSAPAYFVRDQARLRAAHAGEAEDERRVDMACAAIDPRRVHTISARNDYQVGPALRLMLDVAEAARAGRPLVPLDCSAIMENGARLTEAQCLAEFARLGVDQVFSIWPCDPPPGALVCHRLDAGGNQLDLLMAEGNQRLARAKIDRMVVVADYLID